MKKESNKKLGFTLAEVLITLGIIGVVAALTIPTLIKNYKEKVRDNQFKKVYVTIMQAYNASVAEYGYYPKCYYLNNSNSRYHQECSELYEKMKSKLRIAKSCSSKSYQNGCLLMYEGLDDIYKEKHKDDPDYDEQYWEDYANTHSYYFTTNGIKNYAPSWVLSDGIIIIFYGVHPVFLVDINGNKGPNKFGYDVFGLKIQQQENNNNIRFSSWPHHISEGGIYTTTLMQKLFGFN